MSTFQVEHFVKQLKGEDVFVKRVETFGVPHHSPYMESIKPTLTVVFAEVIPEPKPRSDRWISTSIPEKDWNTPLAKKCSAEYQVNNVLSPVLFQEALEKIPPNAVTIEVAPHCLMQAILRRSLENSYTHIGLMKRDSADHLKHLLESFGRIYQAGVTVNIKHLYPPVQGIVPRGTPMIGQLVKWDHSQEYPVVNYKQFTSVYGRVAASCTITVDPFNKESKDRYLLDHIIDGKTIFPLTGYVVLAWKALSQLNGLHFEKTPVILNDVCVFRPTIIGSKPLKFNVTMLSECGKFEITDPDEEGLLAAGEIVIVEDSSEPFFLDDPEDEIEPSDIIDSEYGYKHHLDIEVTNAEIYKSLLIRGYEYGPEFKGIQSMSANRAILKWDEEWISFMDTFLQAGLMAEADTCDSLFLPIRIQYMRIDPQRDLESIQQTDDLKFVPLFADFDTRGVIAGGIEMRYVARQRVSQRSNTPGQTIMERVCFVKNYDDFCFNECQEISDELKQYKRICQAVLANGLDKWLSSGVGKLLNLPLLRQARNQLTYEDKVDQTVLDKLLESKSCSMVQYLHKIFSTELTNEDEKTIIENLSAIANDMMPKLFLDKLWGASFVQHSFKPGLDCAAHNTPGHSSKCGWLEPTDVVHAKKAMELLLTHPLCETEWFLIGPNVDSLDLYPVQYYTCSKRFLDIENCLTVPENCKDLDLVVSDRVLSQKKDIPKYIEQMKKLLRDGGLAMVNEVTSNYELAFAVQSVLGLTDTFIDDSRLYGNYLTHEQWLKMFKDCGLRVIGHRTDPSVMTTIYLLHKESADPPDPVVIEVDDVKEFSWIPTLQEAMNERINEPPCKTIWLTSSQVRDNGTNGLAMSLREEMTNVLRFRFLADVSLQMRDGPPALTMESDLVKKIMEDDLLANHYRDGHIGCFVNMVVKNDEMRGYKDAEHAYIDILSRGDLRTLSWVESPNQYYEALAAEKLSNREICSIYYTSISFRDVMLATGNLPQDAIPNVPGHFDNRDCALGMEYAGRLNDGRRVIGIVPCQALATTVLTSPLLTWPVPDNWSLKDAITVPGAYVTAYYALIYRANLLPGERVLIHSGTGGVGQAAIKVALSMGCEVFTTVGSDEKRQFLLNRFPELDDKHISSSRTPAFEDAIKHATNKKGVDVVLNSLSGEMLKASIRCMVQEGGRFLELGKVDMFQDTKLKLVLFNNNIAFHGILIDSLWDRDIECLELAKLIVEGIESEVVQPLPITMFGRDQVEDAFRYMGSRKHIGKVVVEVRPEEDHFCLPPTITVRAACRTLCHPLYVYVITGGLGGFGLELAQFLVSRGARKLVLTTRQGIRNQYQVKRITHWKKLGVSVVISTISIATEDEAKTLLDQCHDDGPIGGVFHLAMVLRDSMFEDQQVQNFQDSAIAKYWATKYLDKYTREMCGPELRWFVSFSSLSAGRGNMGQTCYAWANSSMERIMEQRHADGLPGMAIQWGAIGDVGIVIEQLGDNNTVIAGTLPQRIHSCFSTLDTFLSCNYPIVSSFVRADLAWKGGSDQQDLLETVARIMGVKDPTTLNLDTKLTNLGLDSLMGVEIKQVVEKNYNVVLSMKDIRNLTLGELKQKVESGGTGEKTIEKKTMLDLTDEEAKQIEGLFKLRIDANEAIPEKDLVQINEIPDEGNAAFFVHSMEGIATPLKSLADQLNFPAYCFQTTADVPADSIEAMASHYIKVMKDIQHTGPYRIVGYSYGATIAFEMAGQLQAEDDESVAHLVLLDGSHRYMKTYREIYRSILGHPGDSIIDDPIFEVELLCGLLLMLTNLESMKFRFELYQLPDWEARVQFFTDRAMQTDAQLASSRESCVWTCNSVRNKFMAADKYHPSHKFQGTLNLIRAKTSTIREEDIGYDYGVAEVATDYQVFVVEGDHETIVNGDSNWKTAQILTNILSDEKQATDE